VTRMCGAMRRAVAAISAGQATCPRCRHAGSRAAGRRARGERAAVCTGAGQSVRGAVRGSTPSIRVCQLARTQHLGVGQGAGCDDGVRREVDLAAQQLGHQVVSACTGRRARHCPSPRRPSSSQRQLRPRIASCRSAPSSAAGAADVQGAVRALGGHRLRAVEASRARAADDLEAVERSSRYSRTRVGFGALRSCAPVRDFGLEPGQAVARAGHPGQLAPAAASAVPDRGQIG
jgi:hypothetical protein